MKVNVVGECCGVALITPDNALNNNQLLLGLNEDNQITPSACVAVTDPDKSVEVSLSGLEVGTNYDVRFGCFNEYPVWPDSMEVDDVLQHWGEKISTYPLEEDSSMYLALVVVILVV